MTWRTATLMWLLGSCSGGGGNDDQRDRGDTDSPSDTDTDTDSDSDTDTDADTDSDADTDVGGQPSQLYFEDFEDVQRASQFYNLSVYLPPYSEGENAYVGIVEVDGSHGAGIVDLSDCGVSNRLYLESPEQFDLTTCTFALLEYDLTLTLREGESVHLSVDYEGMGRNTAVKAPWTWEVDSGYDLVPPFTARQRLPLGWDCGFEDAGAFQLMTGINIDAGGTGCGGVDGGVLVDNVRITTWPSPPAPSTEAFLVHADFNNNELDIEIEGGDYRGYMLGLYYENGKSVTTREDCLFGRDGVVICHPLAPMGGSLPGFAADWVGPIPGYSTGFSETSFDHLTFALFDFDGGCWSWGANPSYYSAAGCQPAPLQ